MFQLSDQLFGPLFVNMLLESLDISFEVDHSLLNGWNVCWKCLSLCDSSRFDNLNLIFALSQILLNISHFNSALLLDIIILLFDDSDVAFIFESMGSESFSIVISLLVIKTYCIILIVAGINLNEVKLISKSHSFNVLELFSIFQLIFGSLYLMLVLEVVFGDLIAYILRICDTRS